MWTTNSPKERELFVGDQQPPLANLFPGRAVSQNKQNQSRIMPTLREMGLSARRSRDRGPPKAAPATAGPATTSSITHTLATNTAVPPNKRSLIISLSYFAK